MALLEDIFVEDRLYVAGDTRVTGAVMMEDNVKIDGELEVDYITGTLHVSSGFSLYEDSDFDLNEKYFNISNTGVVSLFNSTDPNQWDLYVESSANDGSFVLSDGTGKERLEVTKTGDLVLKNEDEDATWTIKVDDDNNDDDAFEIFHGTSELFRIETDGSFHVNTGSVSSLDYAEYFDAEETAKPGEVIGNNLNSGLARIYRPGDFL